MGRDRVKAGELFEFDDTVLPEGEPLDRVKSVLRVMRYVSLILISIFYLAANSSPLIVRFMVVAAMLAEALLIQNLYHYCETKASLLGLILVETMGIAIVILAMGGVESPFVWYALNPVVLSAIFLPALYCWLTMLLFMFTAFAATAIIPGFSGGAAGFLLQHLDLIMIFLVLTLIAQTLGFLINQLADSCAKLEQANLISRNSLEHISSLYQALEAFSIQDAEKLADLLGLYSVKLCAAPAACLLSDTDHDDRPVLKIYDVNKIMPCDLWERLIKQIWETVGKSPEGAYRETEAGKLIYIPIKANSQNLGILACVLSKNEENCGQKYKSLNYLADLGGITMERIRGERLWGRLLVSEEQNRIAGEIHDGVSQYLFSIKCAVHNLSRQDAFLQDESIQQQLALIRTTATKASQELRSSIYKLSSYKRGESLFLDNLASYLDDLASLHNIKANLQHEGSEESLTPALRRALYRLIRESSSNAIRHGQCTSLDIRLWMTVGCTVLEVEDNGCGYKIKAQNKATKEGGLGTRNMRQLVEYLGGKMEITSEPGDKTLLRFTIPDKKLDIREVVR